MGDLASDLYVALAHLIRALRQEVPSGALGPGGVSTVATLARSGPMRASALAQTEGVTAAGMTRILHRLDAAGLVTRMPDPHDGRAQLVALTPAGERLIAEGSEVRLAALRRRLGVLSGREQAALADVVPLLKKLVAGV